MCIRDSAWTDTQDEQETVLAFVRRSMVSDSTSQDLLVIANFTPVVRKDFRMGVLEPGKYKEIFNTDADVYKRQVEDIYKECNYITIHVPALDSTKGMINKAAFDLMQDGTIIVNCARDVLVDETAIGEALKLSLIHISKSAIMY